MISKVASGWFYASVAILFSRHSPSLGRGPLGAEADGGSSAPSCVLAGGSPPLALRGGRVACARGLGAPPPGYLSWG